MAGYLRRIQDRGINCIEKGLRKKRAAAVCHGLLLSSVPGGALTEEDRASAVPVYSENDRKDKGDSDGISG